MIDQLQPVEGPAWLDRASYPFRSRFVETSRGRVHYLDEGPPASEQVVLLVHGTPSWSFEYRHVIPKLAASRRVIAVDHLGFGLSERPSDFAYTPEAHTAVLREVVALLGLTRFSLVVHDYGGPIALPLALDDPEQIASLVVMNSWMWSLESDPSLAKAARFAGSWLGRWLYRWCNVSLRLLMPQAYADRQRLTPHIHRHYLAPFPQRRDRERVLWTLARSLLGSSASFARIWDERARLAAIPCLVVWGLADRALPPRLLERVREALPHAQIETLSDAGHWPQEEAPSEVSRLLDGFLPPAAAARDKLLSA